LDYKKIAVYIIIILVGIGIWYKNRLDENQRREEAERFAHMYAGTMVTAELYRNEPDKFFDARDSIMREYGVDTTWVNRFRHAYEGSEEKWVPVFIRIHNIADSLIEYFKENPIDRDTTVTDDSPQVTDSL